MYILTSLIALLKAIRLLALIIFPIGFIVAFANSAWGHCAFDFTCWLFNFYFLGKQIKDYEN